MDNSAKMIDQQQKLFIGIGAPRCGTTWLMKCLGEHPEISISKPKELHFFSRDHEYKKGKGHYLGLFDVREDHIGFGEFTPFYFVETNTAERIHGMFPDAKLLVVLRDPVKRIISNHAYRVNKGVERQADLTQVLAKDREYYVRPSCYHECLKPFLERFPRENIHISILEDGAGVILPSVFAFLGVDSSFEPPSMYAGVNRTVDMQFKSRTLNGLIAKRKLLRNSQIGRSLLRILTMLGMKRFVRGVESLNKTTEKGRKRPVTVSQPVVDELRSAVASDVRELSVLLDRDLETIWTIDYGQQ